MNNFNETYQVVANICVDEFTDQNGSTVVVPYSNHTGIDPSDRNVNPSHLVSAEAPKGSVIYLLGQTWHDIGNNISGTRRWSIIAYYSRWWVKPKYDYVQSCTEEIYEMCNERQKELLGFTTRPPADWSKRSKTVCDVSKLPETVEEAKDWDGVS